LAEIDWRRQLFVAAMGAMALPAIPFRTASSLTFFYALGYPIGALAVSATSPMAVPAQRAGVTRTALGSHAETRGIHRGTFRR
jgi:hypothetical protein